MADRSLRGARLGAVSLQSEEGVELSARRETVYQTEDGDTFRVVFAEDAEVPNTWVNPRTGQTGRLLGEDGNVEPESADEAQKAPRTHWDMLLERRTRAEMRRRTGGSRSSSPTTSVMTPGMTSSTPPASTSTPLRMPSSGTWPRAMASRHWRSTRRPSRRDSEAPTSPDSSTQASVGMGPICRPMARSRYSSRKGTTMKAMRRSLNTPPR